MSKTAVSQKANDRKKNKGNTIHHENSAKVDILKQEVLQLKEQLSSLAEPRDIDTIERMPPSERKKMEKSADKIGMKLKAGKIRALQPRVQGAAKHLESVTRKVPKARI